MEQCTEEETCSSSRKEWWEGGSCLEVSLCSFKRRSQWPDIFPLVSTPQRFCSHQQHLRLTARPLAQVSSGRLTVQTRPGKMARCFREILARDLVYDHVTAHSYLNLQLHGIQRPLQTSLSTHACRARINSCRHTCTHMDI